ncbi:MAG: tRNA threonylcarbamoyladenosine dehydratase [Eubacterium sp.]|nr:tRNA threonylcarbamoyladenosine dehydratase [Eubacterium sp.]
MSDQFSRTRILVGDEGIDKLHSARVIIFGVGGVGGYVAESLARCGVGHIELVDSDTVSETNINRQIIALHSTVGRYKTEVMRDRIMDINPSAEVVVHNCFYLPETAEQFDFSKYDYIVDAVDTVAAKISIIVEADKKNVPVISSMGAGNKMNPADFQVADIYKTSCCPLAKVMRRELKKRGIKKLKCVYSTELPIKPDETSAEYKAELEESGKRQIPGSTAFAPSVAGLIIASEVFKDMIK